jgi:hypothetical protein
MKRENEKLQKQQKREEEERDRKRKEEKVCAFNYSLLFLFRTLICLFA